MMLLSSKSSLWRGRKTNSVYTFSRIDIDTQQDYFLVQIAHFHRNKKTKQSSVTNVAVFSSRSAALFIFFLFTEIIRTWYQTNTLTTIKYHSIYREWGS